MEERLNQTDLEELSAYMDGELTEPARSRVQGLLATSPAWARALERLQAVDVALDAYVTPSAPADLSRRVLRRTTHAPVLARPSLRWVVPLTAAAAVLVAVLVYGALNRPLKHNRGTGPNPVVNKQSPSAVPPSNAQGPDQEYDEDYYSAVAEAAGDRFAEDHLDFVQDMGVVNDLDTIEAIYNQQSPGEGT